MSSSGRVAVPRVVHVITSLQTGGAEAMLAKLVHAADRARCESFVVSLGSDGPMGARIRAAGVPVFVLSASFRLTLIRDLVRLATAVRQWRPNVLQGWMYHGNLAALLLKLFVVRSATLLWNIRCTLIDVADFPRATRWVIRMSALLSRIPALIIFNSHAAIADHLSSGFKPKRHAVLPNGFDLDHFAPDHEIRAGVRARLSIDERAVVVGMVARYHPMKDFPSFVSAMRRVAAGHQDVCMLLAGPGVDVSNAELRALIADEQLAQKAHVLGEYADVAALLPALDILCLPSAWGEAFPNILGEAMACAVPCVATDVGDVGNIVGDCGIVVPRQSVAALASAIEKLSAMWPGEREALGMRARERIAQRYSISGIVEEYVQTYTRFAYEKR